MALLIRYIKIREMVKGSIRVVQILSKFKEGFKEVGRLVRV